MVCHIWACLMHIMSCLHWDEGKFQLRIAGVSRLFSLRILHFVKCQFESLDKYHRNIFHSNEPCRDWKKISSIWLEGPAFWSPFCLFTKTCNPTAPCARVSKLIPKWTSPTGIVKPLSSVCRLWFSLYFLRFVMTIIIAGEVTGNPLSGLVQHQ